MRNIKTFIASLSLMVGSMAAISMTPSPVGAAASSCSGAQCASQGANTANTGTSKTSDLNNVIKTVVNILLFIIGAVAVVMIVIGGLKYTTSNGDSNQVTSAKNTILYSVIGLLVAIFAYAIVDFVIDAFI